MDSTSLNGRNVVVVGLARTGRAMASFLAFQGARVTATDLQPASRLGEAVQSLEAEGVRLELGTHRIESFVQADLIVVSPGVPLDIDPILQARSRGVQVTGEIELASQFVTAPIVAVTGTNGKTTTTSLIGDILRASGLKVFVGGNIGSPLIGYVHGGQGADVVVIEVSSFQLDTAETLHPRASVLLNITPDHLDRYPDFEAYARSKARVLANQGPQDTAVLNADDPAVAALAAPGRRLEFSRQTRPVHGAYVSSDRIVMIEGGRVLAELPLAELSLVGAHNQENVMASLLAAYAMGVDPDTACQAAAIFRGLPHRVEFVVEINGVRYYDDSKGTNVGAVMKSLEGFAAPVVLIAGGRDKAGDFAPLKPLVREKVKRLVLIGEASRKIADVLGGDTDTVTAADMLEAVTLAEESAVPGDVVLLSPACASFDMFQDYAERGRVFADLVRRERKR